ncbi:hypothetical protein Pla22_31980 [Rubripirellula amarantea]|uniref:Uncharacterized protein n=1 Tax=Rubripirellula amarantea TaxID=2527999 RepID=A0A5C5WK27_9BACT|nr:hypothetical protein Pla22_31980 [Rubripirellula amarantea]
MFLSAVKFCRPAQVSHAVVCVELNSLSVEVIRSSLAQIGKGEYPELRILITQKRRSTDGLRAGDVGDMLM